MKSVIRTGAKLALKIDDGSGERLIGFCTGINYTVSQGTKTIFVVDSPFPFEIASGASNSQVRGSMNIYMLQNTTPESAGLVPYRTSGAASSKDNSPHPGDPTNTIHLAHSKYFHMRLYDRASGELFAGMDYTKVTGYTVSTNAKGIVTASLTFEAKYLISGQG
jgi:hypothetical protein